MKVTSLTITHSLSISIAQYESQRVEITKTVELSSKDNPDEVQQEILDGMREALYAEEKTILKSLKKRRPAKD